jgi:hypothetical protein
VVGFILAMAHPAPMMAKSFFAVGRLMKREFWGTGSGELCLRSAQKPRAYMPLFSVCGIWDVR